MLKSKKQKRENEGEITSEELLKKNLEIAEENQKILRYIKRFVLFSQIWGGIKFLLIVVPIILGILYLPPFLDKWFNEYQDLLFGDQFEKVLENQIQDGAIHQSGSYSIEGLIQ